MRKLAGIACVALVLGMALVGVYEIGHERGVMLGACRVAEGVRPDLDWSKECGGRK